MDWRTAKKNMEDVKKSLETHLDTSFEGDKKPVVIDSDTKEVKWNWDDDLSTTEGTRINVLGKGQGTYKGFKKKWPGKNEHTIEFDDRQLGTQTIKLSNYRWLTKEWKKTK